MGMYNNGMIYPLHLGVTNFKQGCFGLGTRCGWQGGPRLEYWLMVSFGIYTVNRTCFMGCWWILSCKQVLNQPADMTSQWICFMRSREIILWVLSENRWISPNLMAKRFPKISQNAHWWHTPFSDTPMTELVSSDWGVSNEVKILSSLLILQ